ncbi:exodeoxyribonuclease III [Deinococcus frigens]|uniref:exodeoxyribonuclease III n=1 Tax=Deinococcus frigens TaxID=249403 RepID=UPI00055037F6|nr:exodeoxyribonuclease III [Deinococcus frigens]
MTVLSAPLPDLPLKVTTLNVNGIRSALRKGLADWAARESPDVLLLQEVRAPPMPDALAHLGYQGAWFPAQKAGYSGVAILARRPLEDLRVGMGHAEMDAEGRVLSARIGGVRYVSVYLPSGSSGEARQCFKDRVLGDFQDFTGRLISEGGPVIIGGDYNVAHREIDLKNWRSNRGNSGFLPHEREWMSAHLQSGLTDTHRATLGSAAEYTWWSNRAGAYANNVGWRIDYLLSAGVQLGGVRVDREARLSDHAPLSGRLEGG